jgi:hypothetical protein
VFQYDPTVVMPYSVVTHVALRDHRVLLSWLDCHCGEYSRDWRVVIAARDDCFVYCVELRTSESALLTQLRWA